MRGEEKTHVSKPEPGQKAKVITDEFSSPLFDSRFIFEMLLNFETVAHNGVGGYVIPRKITHPSIAALLPGENEQIGEKHGAALARWCASPGGSPAAPAEPKPKTARINLAQATALRDRFRATGADEADFLSSIGVTKYAEITTDKLEGINKTLERLENTNK